MKQVKKQSDMQRQSGFSVFELLVALALGLLVVAGIVQLFVGNSRTYEIVNAQARLQENARFAFEFISRPARMAGFYGCAPEVDNMVSQLNGTWNLTPEYNITQPIWGWDSNDNGTWSPTLIGLPRSEGGTNTNVDIPDNGIDTNDLQESSDLLVFRMVQQPFAQLAETLQMDADPVVLTPGGQPEFDVNDVVVVADCEQATIFRVTNTAVVGDEVTLARATAGGVFQNGVNVLNAAGDIIPATLSIIGRSYGATAIVGRVESHFFFIAESTEDAQNGSQVFALWQKVGSGAPRELVRGVEDMQILYGVDPTGGDVIAVQQYLPADGVGDPQDVVAIQVRLTVSSVEPLAENGGEPLQRTFSKTIHVRNG